MFIDPAAKEQDSSDASNILISKSISEQIVKINYPNVNLDKAKQESERRVSNPPSSSGGQVLQASNAQGVRYYRLIDRYTKIRIPRFHVYDPINNYENIFENQQEYDEWGNQSAFIITRLGSEFYITEQTQIDELEKTLEQYGSVYHAIINPTDPNQMPQLVSGVEFEPYAIPGSTTQLQKVTKKIS